jgi:hypothetical protein
MRILIYFLYLACALTPLSAGQQTSNKQNKSFPGWPAQFHGQELVQVHLSAQEQRFVKGFPGRIGRFSRNSEEVILRWVTHASRKLHPASDCYKGSGYAITPQPIQVDFAGKHWGCFHAKRDGESLEVCEQIYDKQGNSWSDVSSWFWGAMLGHTQGPWWAVTVAKDLQIGEHV